MDGQRWSGLCALLMMCLLFTGPVQAQVDPWLEWQSIETPHFHVHFPQGLETPGRRAAYIAESVHEELSDAMDWQPRQKTHLVITDQFDQANGWATPIPYNTITLYLTPPDDLSSLGQHDGWMRLLITHEYAHILHLDKARGFPHGARRVLGRHPLLFPNLFNPTWLIEGLAVHEESDRDSGVGRAHASYFEMKFRQELREGFKPFDQVGMDGLRDWPAGRTPYLYGAFFFRFVEESQGEDSIRALVNNYSNNPVPYLLNANLRRTLGQDGSGLWSEFEAWGRQQFLDETDSSRQAEANAGEQLTEHGFQSASPRAIQRNGEVEVYYLRSDAKAEPALMRWSESEGSRHLADINAGARLDVHPEHGVLIAMPEICRNRNQYYDLYHLDLDGGRLKRLTECSRYRDVVWRPDGRGMVASRIEAGLARIDRLDRNGRRLYTLWQSDDDAIPGRLSMAPDGRSIALSLWQAEQGWGLHLLDLRRGQMRDLAVNSAALGDARFSADGESIFFSSDHGGYFDIRQFTLENGEARSLTQVPGGAFAPSQAIPGGDLFYIGYTAGGHDLYRIAADQLGAEPLPEARHFQARSALDGQREEPADAYRARKSLLPTYWSPLAAATESTLEVGAMTEGVDALRLHQYSVAGLLEVTEGFTSGAVSYNYAGRLGLGASRIHDYYLGELAAEDETSLLRARSEDRADLVWTLPKIRDDWTLALHLGGAFTREQDRYTASAVDPWDPMRSAAAGVALSWDDSSRYLRSISPSDGRQIRLLAEDNSVFGSDFSGPVYSLDWREYLRLGGEQVLYLRGVHAQGQDAPRPFRLGGAHAGDLLDVGGLFDRRRYALRGYDTLETGRRLQLATAEWRFPISRPQRGFTRFPLGAHQFSGRFLAEAGAAWDEGSRPDDYRRSLGAELVMDLNLFYRANLSIRLGYAKGLDDDGIHQGYLLLSSPF